MMKSLAVLLFLQFVFFASGQITAPKPQPQGSMPPVQVRALVQPDIDALLIAHNKVRKEASPAPKTPLSKATWNDNLRKEADAQVINCNPKNINSSDGVNYIWTQSSNYISRDNFPTRIVTQWASQSQFYNYKTRKCNNPNGTCSAYLQLVTAASSFTVGCARSITCLSNDVVRPHSEYVICLYSAAADGTKKPY